MAKVRARAKTSAATRAKSSFLQRINSRARASAGSGLKRSSAGVGRTFARYLDARKALRGSISARSRQGLDWTNFFLADVQTGFGAFVAFYLAGLGWAKGQVGLALTIGTLAGVISQIPGGALVDAVPWKRALLALGILMIAASALIFALLPTFVLVFMAEILQGLSAGLVTPTIAAISLGLVGRRAMSTRTGRNYRYAAAGTALTAGCMGVAAQYFSNNAIFLGAAVLCIPALVALGRIRGDEIDYARARNAEKGERARNYHRIFDIGKNHNLYIFAACVFAFQLADASMLPVVSENLAQSKGPSSSLVMASLIVVPQIVVALLSPWVGFHSERWGRKPLLLLGFGFETVRAILFAFSGSVPVLLAAQFLGGMSAAAVTVLTVLITTDLTTGTGRFNLVRGFIGTLVAIAASISTSASGFIFELLGQWQGFLCLIAISAAATALVWIAMPETKPGKYLD